MLHTSRSTSGAQVWGTGLVIAIGSVAGAVVFRWVLQNFIIRDDTPFLLLFAAVLISAAFGGLIPGLLATLLAAICSILFFNDVGLSDGLDAVELTRVLLFLTESVFISVFGARLQAARRRAEASEAEARHLEQTMLDISDAERRRIGQDLHDGLGQTLTGVAFLSKALQQRLANKQLAEASDATKIASLVSESIGQTRALAKGLAPLGLEDGGLVSALTQLANATTGVFNVKCSCRCDPHIELNDLPIASHLYRIAQESVHNAIRHGNATDVQVRLDADNGTLRLSIDDNGIGITPRSDHGGMGLQIMNFRARMIGGKLSVQRREQGGTSVVCIAPVPAPV
jgi:signal transduction histidine kinase